LAAAGPQRSRVLATLYKVNASLIKHFKSPVWKGQVSSHYGLWDWIRMSGVQS